MKIEVVPIITTPPPSVVQITLTLSELKELCDNILYDFMWDETNHQDYWGNLHEELDAVRESFTGEIKH